MTEQQTSGSMTACGRDAWQGQVLVIFAISLVALLGFAALAIDVGYYLAERRNVQNATDSAAMAAARLMLRNDTTDLTFQAESFVASHGYPDAEVDVYPGEDEVRVVVEQEIAQFFVGMFVDSDAWTVTTDAVAEISTEDVPFALIALGEDQYCSDPTGVRLSGSTMDLHLEGGGIATNACVRVDGGLVASIDGNIEAHGTISDWVEDWDITGTAIENQGTVDDPYEDFAENNDPRLSSHCKTEHDEDPDGDPIVLKPGYYPPGTDLQFKSNTDVVMESGIYCIDTAFQIGKGPMSSLDASSGVLIYLMEDGSFDPGNGDYELASYSSDWKDFVIWAANCSDLDMHGNGEMSIDGVIYAPCSSLDLGGNSGQSVVNGQVVARDVRLHGNTTFNIDAGDEFTADPLRVFLVE